MFNLTRTLLAACLAAAFATASLNVSATETLAAGQDLEKQTSAPTPAERMKLRAMDNVIRSQESSSQAFNR